MKKTQLFLFIIFILLITGCTKGSEEMSVYKNQTLGFELQLPKAMMDSKFFEVDEATDDGKTSIMFVDGEESEDKIYSGGVVFTIVKSNSMEGFTKDQQILETEGVYYFFITPEQPIEDTAFDAIFKKYEPSFDAIKASFKF